MMGCDIHMILQRKRNDKWVTILADIFPARWYYFFSILSNVRGNSPLDEKVMKDGFPEDFEISEDNLVSVSPIISDNYEEDENSCDHSFGWIGLKEDENSCEYWMGDHSFGWIGLDELKRFYVKDAKCTADEDAQVLLNKFIWAMTNLFCSLDLDNYRIVVGYDN